MIKKVKFNSNQQSVNQFKMKSQSQQFTKVAFSLLQSGSGLKSSQKQRGKLNLFGKGITFIKTLSQQEVEGLKSVKQIDLSHNALTSIENLRNLPIESLNVSHNKLSQQEQFLSVLVNQRNTQLSKNLSKLVLKGNPLTKKPLVSQFRRYLFSIENDLQLFTREQHEYLDLLVQRVIEKLTLESLLTRVEINFQFIKEYSVQLEDDHERLVIMRPEDYFKLLRRQMEWKLQSQQPFGRVKKWVVRQLSLQLFNSTRQKPGMKLIASPLVLQLRKRNQQLVKTNKQLLSRIQSVVLSYLTQKKMMVEKQHQSGVLQRVQSIKTPLKNIRTEKNVQSDGHGAFLEVSTPMYVKKQQSHTVKPTPTITISESEGLQSKVAQSLTQRKQTPVGLRSSISSIGHERNPFEEIISEEDGDERENLFLMNEGVRTEEKHKLKQTPLKKSKQKQKNKENILASDPANNPSISIKKPQIKSTSKTLFELSQSLLQKPVMPSDESVNFMLEQGLAESQIEKMFFSILTKINPFFHLLLSPLQSLKQTEKNQLIEQLLELLKEKMKYVERLERYKVLYEGERQKNQEYQNMSRQFKAGKEQLVEKNDSLKKELNSLQKQFQLISYELQAKAQENFSLKQENETLKFQMSRFGDIKLERCQQEEIEEKIIKIRQLSLKRMYFNQMALRSQKFSIFRDRMSRITGDRNKMMLFEVYKAWALEAKTTKHFKVLYQSFMGRNFQYLHSTLTATVGMRKQTNEKYLKLKNSLKLLKLQSFVKRLADHKFMRLNLAKAQNCYSKKLKKGLFSLFKQNRQEERQLKCRQMVIDFRQQSKKRMKRWVFDEWLIWQRGLLHKQIQVRVNHEGVLACNVIGKLCDFYSYQRSFGAKSLALQLYLRDIRKINSFHKLLHEMSLCVQTWRLKLFKINMFTKRAYFDNYLSGVRRLKNKRRIKQKQEQSLQRKMVFGQMKQARLKRSIKLEKFGRILKEGIREIMKERVWSMKKEIEVERLYRNVRCGGFFQSLRAVYSRNSQLRQKQREVGYVSKRYIQLMTKPQQHKKRSFFLYMRTIIRMKHQLTSFLSRRNKHLMGRTFYQLRVQSLKGRSAFYEQKLKQLGPDIDMIEERQIETNIEKMGLERELQLRTQQIEEYEREVAELRLLLEAKEIKYEKLKDIYAEAVQIQSRGRDLYEGMERSLAVGAGCFDADTKYINVEESRQSNQSDKSKYLAKSSNKAVDSERKRKAYNYNYSKYSPERDTKSDRKRVDFMGETKKKDYQVRDKNVITGKNAIADGKNAIADGKNAITDSKNSIADSKSSVNENTKGKLSDFYPSFRRF